MLNILSKYVIQVIITVEIPFFFRTGYFYTHSWENAGDSYKLYMCIYLYILSLFIIISPLSIFWEISSDTNHSYFVILFIHSLSYCSTIVYIFYNSVTFALVLKVQ